MSLKIELPRVFICNDYHEITDLPIELYERLGIKVKTKEIGLWEGYYVSLVYEKKLPSNNEIGKLLKARGWHPLDDESLENIGD